MLIRERDQLDALRRELTIEIKALRREQTVANARRATGIRDQKSMNAKERARIAIKMRDAGSPFAEIGKAIGGVSAARASQIYRFGQRWIRYHGTLD